jgi:hypothetical protein
MYARIRTLNASLSLSLLRATTVATLFALPLAAQAQTNTAYGTGSLSADTTGIENSAFGYEALFNTTTGGNNTAAGVYALFNNTTGSYNSGFGQSALNNNQGGSNNTAVGYFALFCVQGGSGNTGLGFYAGGVNHMGGNNNTFIGMNAGGSVQYSPSNNICIGANAGDAIGNNNITCDNNIEVGNEGTGTDNNVIRIGVQGTQKSTYIAGIDGATATKGVTVFVTATGQLGTLKSSRRFKNDIHDMGSVSDKLMKLRPVTFRYNDLAEKGPHDLQYGLIAEEVAKVYPDLVQYDKQGKPYTIYYHLLTPMILNELQKEHRQNVAQNARISALAAAHNADKAAIAALKAAHESDRAEIAALKQSQQQQLAAMAKLSGLVQAAQNRAAVASAAYVQH